MTPRARVLFNLVLGLSLCADAGAETAPDQPSAIAPATPVEPAKPKRRYTDRVTFHEGVPLSPAKPVPAAGENQLPRQAEPGFDPVEALPLRPPPPTPRKPPTREQIEEAKARRNWLRVEKLGGAADDADRRLADAALGIRSEEEARAEELRDESETGGENPSDTPGGFGDFFSRMEDRGEALADVNLEDDSEAEARARETELEEEKELEAKEKADATRAANVAAGGRTAEPPVFTSAVGPAPSGSLASRGSTGSQAAAETRAEFRPALASPGFEVAQPAAPRVPERATFQASNELISSLGIRNPPAESGFKPLDFPAASGGDPRSASPAASFRPAEAAGFRPAAAEPSLPGFGTRAGVPSEIPPAGPRFSLPADAVRPGAEFGGLRPALPGPATAELAPRVDRWERDRMQSQLLGEPGPRTAPRRAAP